MTRKLQKKEIDSKSHANQEGQCSETCSSGQHIFSHENWFRLGRNLEEETTAEKALNPPINSERMDAFQLEACLWACRIRALLLGVTALPLQALLPVQLEIGIWKNSKTKLVLGRCFYYHYCRCSFLSFISSDNNNLKVVFTVYLPCRTRISYTLGYRG